MRFAVLLLALPAAVLAQSPPQEAEIQRALIQRDRQSAEFSRPELRELHARQDRDQGAFRADERERQARERDAVPRLEQPVMPAADYRPLPLPGGPRHGVDPIPVQGVAR